MKPNFFPARAILLAITIPLSPWMGRGAEADSWARKANMPTPRMGLSTCPVNGKIYAIGGYPAGLGAAITTVEAYDPETDSWTRKAAMPNARVYFASAVVNGKIYAIGGDRNALANPLRTVDEYDPASDTWTRKADMPTARWGLTCAAVDGKIYAVGGFTTFGGAPLSVLEVYDPATDTWQSRAAMPTPRGLLCASAAIGKIFAIGSSRPPDGPWLATVEMYDPLTDSWTPRANMPTARGVAAASTVRGLVYVIGGRSGSTGFPTVEVYDPVADSWTRRANMFGQRFSLGTSEVNGRIYAIGGASAIPNDVGLTVVEEYTPPDINTGPPVIYSQPRNKTELPGGSVTLAVVATGGQPISYQWLLDGAPVNNATNATLTFGNLEYNQSGSYRVLVSNSVGSVSSRWAALNVVPVAVTSQTGNTNVWRGSNVTIQVAITSTVPTSCQWRFNGENIIGATALMLGLTNIQMTQEGEYTAVLANSFGSVTSAVTRLSVLVRPEIVQPPLSQSVVAGGSVTLSVGIRGNPAPFGFQWRRSATVLTNLVLSERTCFLTLANVQTNQGGTYRVVITNAASPTLTVNATFNLTVLADADSDGLPDEWENVHGLNATDPADALLDADGDGHANLQEYLAGTDPTNALSELGIDSVALINGATEVALRFQAVSNRTYTVQTREAVERGLWNRVADIVATPTNHIVEISDPVAMPSNGQKFYRVVTPRIP